MNICFLNDIRVLGGGEVWVLRACDYLREQDSGAAVACPRDSGLHRECAKRGIAHYTYAPGGLETEGGGLGDFIGAQRVDVLYCTVMGNCREARVLERVARRLESSRKGSQLGIILKAGLPPIGGLTPQHYGCGGGPGIRRLHVVAPSIRQAFLNWEPAFEGGFIKVFREGIDLEAFSKNGANDARIREQWKIPPDHLVVTCLGRLEDGMKGQGVLLRSVRLLRDAHPNVTFVVAGDGLDKTALEELADDLGIASAVRFTGYVDNVAGLLSATNVLCHPSLHDGLPNAVVEAMAMEVPVVASRVGAIPELAGDGVFLVRPNDPSALAAALDALLRTAPSERSRLGAAGRARLHADWSLRTNLGAWLAGIKEELRAYEARPELITAPPNPPVPAKVLFVLRSLRTGGEETELAILARNLDRRRFPMFVLSFDEASEEAPALEKLNAWRIPVDTVCHRIPEYSDRVEYLLAKIRQEHIRIVVACHDPHLVYEAFAHLRPSECRLIEHGGLVEDAAQIPKDRTSRYIGVSSTIRAAAARRMPQPDGATLIPSMVDTDEFDSPEFAPARDWCRQWLRGDCLTAAGLGEDASVIVLVGRFDPRKRILDLIAAARDLQDLGALFLIIGGPDSHHPEYAKRLKEQSRELMEAKRLVITGPRSDIAGLLCASDILVQPAIGEGMSHVIHEAGAAGLAVVASDDGAAREQLDGGECGILIEPGNVRQLTGALRTLIGGREIRRRLGSRLRDRVRRLYSARVVVEQWHSALAEVVEEMDA